MVSVQAPDAETDAMTDPSADVERPKFEADFVAQGWPECVLARDCNGEHIFDAVSGRFKGWLAKARDKEKGL